LKEEITDWHTARGAAKLKRWWVCLSVGAESVEPFSLLLEIFAGSVTMVENAKILVNYHHLS